MILPTKHISIDDCLITKGAQVLQTLSRPQSVSHLWETNKKTIGSYERFSLTLAFLYTIDAIKFSDELIKRCTP